MSVTLAAGARRLSDQGYAKNPGVDVDLEVSDYFSVHDWLLEWCRKLARLINVAGFGAMLS